MPHSPIPLGGNAPNVLQRVVRWGDGWLPNRVTPGQVEKARKILDILAAEWGRDPASLSILVFGQPADTTRDRVDAFLNAGAERVSVWPAHCETENEMGEQLGRMADALLR